MNIFEMTNEILASVLEVIIQHERFNDWTLHGFNDDPNKRYRAAMFLQEAASRLSRMKESDEEDEKLSVGQTAIVIPPPPEKQEEPKPDEEPTPSEREVLKKAIVMLAEAVKDRSSSSAFDTCNKVQEMMRTIEK